jgi:hypothetical protein
MKNLKVVQDVDGTRIVGAIPPMFEGPFLVTHQEYNGEENMPCQMVSKTFIGFLSCGLLRVIQELESDFVAATGIGTESGYYLEGDDLIETVKVKTLYGEKRIPINHGDCVVKVPDSNPARLVFFSTQRELFNLEIPYEEIEGARRMFIEKEKAAGVVRNILGDVVNKKNLRVTCILGGYYVADEFDHPVHSESYKNWEDAKSHLSSFQ